MWHRLRVASPRLRCRGHDRDLRNADAERGPLERAVPKALRVAVAEIATMMIDELYAEHLVDEYGALCCRLLDKLARK